MQVSHVDKNMVEQSTTVPQSIYKRGLNPTLGLTLLTPGLVLIKIRYQSFSMYKHFSMSLILVTLIFSEVNFNVKESQSDGIEILALLPVCLGSQYQLSPTLTTINVHDTQGHNQQVDIKKVKGIFGCELLFNIQADGIQ